MGVISGEKKKSLYAVRVHVSVWMSACGPAAWHYQHVRRLQVTFKEIYAPSSWIKIRVASPRDWKKKHLSRAAWALSALGHHTRPQSFGPFSIIAGFCSLKYYQRHVYHIHTQIVLAYNVFLFLAPLHGSMTLMASGKGMDTQKTRKSHDNLILKRN